MKRIQDGYARRLAHGAAMKAHEVDRDSQQIASFNETGFVLKANIFDKSKAISGYILVAGTGIATAFAGYHTSDFIPVLPNTQYTKSGTVRFCYYDANKQYISGVGDGTSTFTTPASCYFIRISLVSTGLSGYMVVAGASVPATYIPYGYNLSGITDARVDALKQWENKKWYSVGDSITAASSGYANASNVPYQLGLFSVSNGGVSGASTVSYKNNSNLSTAQITASDLVTVFLGTNDYGGSVALGAITDAVGADTTYGALKYLAETILSTKPTVKLAFFTPLKRGAVGGQPTYPAANSGGFTLEDYVAAIKAVCGVYSIPVCDLFNISGISSITLSTYLSDGLHPSAAGTSKISTIISNFLNTI